MSRYSKLYLTTLLIVCFPLANAIQDAMPNGGICTIIVLLGAGYLYGEMFRFATEVARCLWPRFNLWIEG